MTSTATTRIDVVTRVLTDHHLNFSDEETRETAEALLEALDEFESEQASKARHPVRQAYIPRKS